MTGKLLLAAGAVLSFAVTEGDTGHYRADNGLAVYGPRFGRYPVGPCVEVLK